MASTQKTSLGFNQWVETDKPVMQDFNADNALAERLIKSMSCEVGSWTPKLAGNTVAGNHVYIAQSGQYVKIGRFVSAHFYIHCTNGKDDAASGAPQILGLPFANAATRVGGSFMYVTGITGMAGASLVPSLAGSTSAIIIRAHVNGNAATFDMSKIGSSFVFQGSIHYITY